MQPVIGHRRRAPRVSLRAMQLDLMVTFERKGASKSASAFAAPADEHGAQTRTARLPAPFYRCPVLIGSDQCTAAQWRRRALPATRVWRGSETWRVVPSGTEATLETPLTDE